MINPGIQNSIVINSVNDLFDHIIKFSKDRLLEKYPRHDYRELLELSINSHFFLGGKLSSDISFKIAGFNCYSSHSVGDQSYL